MDVRSGGLLPPGDRLRLRAHREFFQGAAGARACAAACVLRAAGKPRAMHPDLDQQRSLARRLRELPDEAAQPYDWREFQCRSGTRTRPGQGRAGGRAVAAATVLALGVVAVWTRLGGWSPPPPPPASAAAARPPPQAAPPPRPR